MNWGAKTFPDLTQYRCFMCLTFPFQINIITAVYLHPADLSCDDPDLQDACH